MGGEPTFVSIDDHDGAEWTTAALGPAKRKLRRGTVGPAAPALCSWRPAAFRTGQVVSRRTAAALGVRLATGARMASPSGKMPASSPSTPRITAIPPRTRANSWRLSRAVFKWTPLSPSPPTKTSSIICGKNASCRSTSIRSIPSSPIRSSAPAWRAFSNRAWTSLSVMSCRCAASRLIPARRVGPASPGSSLPNKCSWSPAIRPWDTVCRSSLCRGPSRKTSCIPTTRILLRNARAFH